MPLIAPWSTCQCRRVDQYCARSAVPEHPAEVFWTDEHENSVLKVHRILCIIRARLPLNCGLDWSTIEKWLTEHHLNLDATLMLIWFAMEDNCIMKQSCHVHCNGKHRRWGSTAARLRYNACLATINLSGVIQDDQAAARRLEMLSSPCFNECVSPGLPFLGFCRLCPSGWLPAYLMVVIHPEGTINGVQAPKFVSSGSVWAQWALVEVWALFLMHIHFKWCAQPSAKLFLWQVDSTDSRDCA